MKQSVTIYLPFKVSTNSIYSQSEKWQQRKKHKDLMLWAFMPVHNQLKPVSKAKIRIDFEFARQPLDCSNCSYMAKMIEDCLTYFGIIPDDSPKYITEMTIRSAKGKEDLAILTLETDE
jgi:hypothetical protein